MDNLRKGQKFPQKSVTKKQSSNIKSSNRVKLCFSQNTRKIKLNEKKTSLKVKSQLFEIYFFTKNPVNWNLYQFYRIRILFTFLNRVILARKFKIIIFSITYFNLPHCVTFPKSRLFLVTLQARPKKPEKKSRKRRSELGT